MQSFIRDRKSWSFVAKVQAQRKLRISQESFREKLRSCQYHWFDQYHWMQYDDVSGSVFCFMCMKHDNLGNLKGAMNREDVFTKTEFINWKKATDRFSEYQKSKCHKLALTFVMTIPKCGDVLDMSNDAALKRWMEERKYFTKVVNCVKFLAW